jgi:Cu(I)/Ag(I) efflux system membrane fusion protein
MTAEHEPSSGGLRVMATVRWVLLALTASLAAFSWWSIASADPSTQNAPRYYCPMHPAVTSHDPGECPICHMTLEPIPEQRKKAKTAKPPSSGAAASSAKPTEAQGDLYTCPMHPEVKSDKPGRCPICKMDLVKQRPATPPGTTALHLTLDRVQAIGVRTALVESAKSGEKLRAPATIESPESGFAAIHARAAGFVERIAVKETGVKVRAGQELAALYSPEIFQAETELLAVSRWQGPDAALTAERVKQKLSLLGVGEATVKRVLERGEPERALGLVAPISGFVVKKNVVLGSYVTPDVPLFEIVDLSRVYVVANLYPEELALVGLGSEGTFHPAKGSDASLAAKVDLVYPAVDANARTTRVRLQVKNPDAALTPGEYGSVEFAVRGRSTVSIPRDALIDTGRDTYVFVALEEQGHFEPRSVEIGAENDDRIEVRRGLEAGERVVSGATFLIDSESRLRASLLESEAPKAP